MANTMPTLTFADKVNQKTLELQQKLQPTRKYAAVLAVVLCLAVLATSFAAASSTDSMLMTWADWIEEKITGSGGLLLALVALVAVIWNVMLGNMKTVGALILIILLTTAGPTVVRNMYSFVF